MNYLVYLAEAVYAAVKITPYAKAGFGECPRVKTF